MAGGEKQSIVNPQERCASADINRLQAFVGADRAELMRQLLDATLTEDSAGGVATVGLVTTSPLRATVINGLLVRPQIGNGALSVDAGVVFVVDPDVVLNADDSPYKFVNDPGLAAGNLSLTANSSGSTRFDVIECARNPDVVLEASPRDVFNVNTGLFTPATLPKVKCDRLTYRIRQGTPAAGFPGTVAGWLPLAVAKVPNGASAWDACDLWDVRPLAADHARNLMQIVQPYPRDGAGFALAESPDGTARNLVGVFEGEINGLKAGGNVTLDIRETNTSVVEPGFSAAQGPWHIYAVFPFSLPRWCLYTPFTSGQRIPGGFRGIPVYTQRFAQTIRGFPTTGIALPTGLGFGSVTVASASCVQLFSGAYGAGPTWVSAIKTGNKIQLGGAGNQFIQAATANPQTINLAAAGMFPARAVRVLIRIDVQFTIAGNAGQATSATDLRIVTLVGSGAANVVWQEQKVIAYPVYNGSSAYRDSFIVDVPLWAPMPSGDQSVTRKLQVTYSGLAPNANVVYAIMGWEMGP